MLEEAFQKYERLPTELAEEIPRFTPELKSGLAEFAREARDRGKSEAYRARAEALERKRGPALWSDYLLAQIANQANDEPAWERELLKIGDRLAQASAWAQAREIGEEILGSHPSAPAARLAVRAIEALGDDAALDDALERAWSIDSGNPEIALRLSARARSRGDAAAGLEWQGAALKGLAEAGQWERFEEAVLAVLSGDEAAAHEEAIAALATLYRLGELKRAGEYLELGLARW